MVVYVLDTNICIYIINQKPVQVRDKFASTSLHDLAISSISLFELDAGARKGSQADANLDKLTRFASLITVLAFDAAAAREAGRLRQHLRSQGTPIRDMDVLIAAHVLSLDAVVVTNNVQEFQRVPELQVENWLN
ncbi:MAG: PIN domain-containing protein [Deinococcota bacterium]